MSFVSELPYDTTNNRALLNSSLFVSGPSSSVPNDSSHDTSMQSSPIHMYHNPSVSTSSACDISPTCSISTALPSSLDQSPLDHDDPCGSCFSSGSQCHNDQRMDIAEGPDDVPPQMFPTVAVEQVAQRKDIDVADAAGLAAAIISTLSIDSAVMDTTGSMLDPVGSMDVASQPSHSPHGLDLDQPIGPVARLDSPNALFLQYITIPCSPFLDADVTPGDSDLNQVDSGVCEPFSCVGEQLPTTVNPRDLIQRPSLPVRHDMMTIDPPTGSVSDDASLQVHCDTDASFDFEEDSTETWRMPDGASLFNDDLIF